MPAETKKNPMLVPFLTVMLMLASVAGSLLVTASKSADGTYAYSHNSSVMLSELCKLLLSAGILLWQLLMKGPTGGPKITVSMQVPFLRLKTIYISVNRANWNYQPHTHSSHVQFAGV